VPFKSSGLSGRAHLRLRTRSAEVVGSLSRLALFDFADGHTDHARSYIELHPLLALTRL